MKRSPSLRLIDNAPVLQDAVESKAFLFAQLAMSTAKRENVTTAEVINEHNKDKKIILLS